MMLPDFRVGFGCSRFQCITDYW